MNKAQHLLMCFAQSFFLLAVLGGSGLAMFAAGTFVGRLAQGQGAAPLVVVGLATMAMVATICLIAWKVLSPYFDWIEPRLRGTTPWFAA